MKREFIPFDEETKAVGLGNPSPAQVDDYGDGLYRLRHIKPAYQGRLIYFAADREKGFERLVILSVYKKQAQRHQGPCSRRLNAERRNGKKGGATDELDKRSDR